MVQRERVQQRTAEQIEDAPQSPCRGRRGGDVSRVNECNSGLPAKTGVCSVQLEQAFVDLAEAAKIALRKRFEGMCEQHGVNEVAKVLKKCPSKNKGITEVPKAGSQDRRVQRDGE